MSLNECPLPQQHLPLEARLTAAFPSSKAADEETQQDEQRTFCAFVKPMQLAVDLMNQQTDIVLKIL